MLVRSDDGTELFLNGIQQGATYPDSNDYGTAKPVTLGGDYNNATHFTGYIDEVRISSQSQDIFQTLLHLMQNLQAIWPNFIFVRL